MENSSRSQILQDSPIVLPADAFPWAATIGVILGAAVILLVLTVILLRVWLTSQGYSLSEAVAAANGLPGVALQSAAEIVAIAFVILLLPKLAKVPLRTLGFRSLSPESVATIAIGIVAMFVVATLLSSLLQSLLHFKTPEAAIAVYMRLNGWQRAAFVFFGVIIAPFCEETFFRVLLFNAFRRWWGLIPGALVSSILFGVAHSQAPFNGAMLLSITLPLSVGGLVLAWVYVKTGSFWANFTTHAAFNCISFVLLALFPQLAK